MRKRFEVQLALGQLPIEKVILPLKSRDELPPILAGLKWVFVTPEVSGKIFELLEKKVIAGKKATGRRGLDLWQILVLGVVRLGLDCDYDRLEHLANYDSLLRQILGVSPVMGPNDKPFHYKTLSDNVSLVDEELLAEINAIVAQEGRSVFKKKGPDAVEPLEVKVDTYVVETNVHFPTDLNLLWDAQRKCLDAIEALEKTLPLEGWRKAADWRKRLKGQMRQVSRACQGGGADKQTRVTKAARECLEASYRFESKVFGSIGQWKMRAMEWTQILSLEQLEYYHEALMRQIDQVERRLIRGEKIAHEEKVFSLFEPHTQWIVKGKLFPPVELGHKVLIASDQDELIVDYKVMEQLNDAQELLPLADRLLGRYGTEGIASLSADKGFSRSEDRELLECYIGKVVVPKKGKRTEEEHERETHRSFRKLRHQHSAVESDINSLEHHGLNRCLDKGLHGFKRYVGLGVLSYNLHKIGAQLIRQKRGFEGLKMAV